MEELAIAIAGIFAGSVFILYALLSIIASKSGGGNRKKQPPEARGGLPVIGHLHLLKPTEPIQTTLAKMADIDGPIFTLKLGMNKALVVSNWEIAKECFTTNDRIFASRPKTTAGKLLGYDYALKGATPYGPMWRHVRKIVALELLSNHRLEQLKHIRISEVQSWIKNLYELCVNGSEGKVLVDMTMWFGDIGMNTMFRMVVGKRSTATLDHGDNKEYWKALRDFFKLFGAFVPSDSLPFLKWLDLGENEKAMKKTMKILDQVLDNWIKEHREEGSSDYEIETQANDFLDVMISTLKHEDQLSTYDDDTLTKATCLALILGGSDTTSITMQWAISLRLNNQEKLKKVQVELDEQIGRERKVEESDVKNLLYLQAVVKETLRLYPPAPIAIPHEATENCIVANYHISAKTQLIVNLQKLHRDPVVWEEPNEFRPERFLTSQKDFDVRGQSPQLIPFGNGRRISFALQIMHLTLANLLHLFEVNRPSEELLDMEEGVGITCLRKKSLQIVSTPHVSHLNFMINFMLKQLTSHQCINRPFIFVKVFNKFLNFLFYSAGKKNIFYL